MKILGGSPRHAGIDRSSGGPRAFLKERKMGGWELKEGYDYTQHWSHRDRNEPRLAGTTREESMAEFIHQVSCDLARAVYERFDDAEFVAKEFAQKLIREKYMIVRENLYGFGIEVIDGGFDALVDGLWEKIQPEFTRELIGNIAHMMQCNTLHKTEEEWLAFNARYIEFLAGHGVENLTFERFEAQERERVRKYMAEEDEWIRRSGGWRGD
jgi:hypothetical protein